MKTSPSAPERDLDLALRRLRETGTGPTDSCLDGLFERLGPPAIQLRRVFHAGVLSCAVAVALAAWIGTRHRTEVPTVPPEFTLLTQGGGPLASL